MKLCLVLLAIVGLAVGQDCQRMCTMEYLPVCGTDGRTYGNKCSLTSEACLSQSGVEMAYEGECCDGRCTRIYRPVCGSDGVTYSNECELKRIACESKSGVTLTSQGDCPSSEENSCPRKCPRINRPVCGSDGKTYRNACRMNRKACRKGTPISIVSNGRC